MKNNKENVSKNSAKSPKKKMVFTILRDHTVNICNGFMDELKISPTVFIELKNPNQYIFSNQNPDEKPDIIVIVGHGTIKNEGDAAIHNITVNDESTKIRHKYETASIVKELAKKSKDDASFIIESCRAGQSGIDILRGKSLKADQSAIILGGTNKLIHNSKYLNKSIKALSMFARHEGKVSDELINELKDYYPSTFSIVQNSKLTKYSRLKYDFKSKKFYREISVFDEKEENDKVWKNKYIKNPNSNQIRGNFGWTKKRREYIEKPNLDLLLGFCSSTYLEIKQSDKGKKCSKEKINKKVDKSLETLKVVINTLDRDISNLDVSDGISNLAVKELIVYQLEARITYIIKEIKKETHLTNYAEYSIEFCGRLIDILSERNYEALSQQFLNSSKEKFDKLKKESESDEGLRQAIGNKLDGLHGLLTRIKKAKKGTFATKNKKSPLFLINSKDQYFISNPRSKIKKQTNNKTNASQTNAEPPKPEVVLVGFYSSNLSSDYSTFRDELKKNKNVEEVQNLGNGNKNPDIILIASNGGVDSLEKKHVTYIDKNSEESFRHQTANFVKNLAQKSKDDATFIIESCYTGQAGIDILSRKSLKDNQSAIILGETNEFSYSFKYFDKDKKALSIIAKHGGKVSGELIKELKDSSSSTFLIIQNSQLTQYSKLKYEFESKKFYREISVFEENGKNGGVWIDKEKEYIEKLNPDLLLGFVAGTFAEGKQNNSWLDVVIDRLQTDVSNTPDENLVNELIIQMLTSFISSTYDNESVSKELRDGVINILCEKDYKGLSLEFFELYKKTFDELIGKIKSSKEINSYLGLQKQNVDKLNNFFKKIETNFPSKPEESSMINFIKLDRISLYEPRLEFDYNELNKAYELYGKKQYNETIKCLARIERISNIPDKYKREFHNLLGCCVFGLGQYKDAEIEFENALKYYQKESKQTLSMINSIKLNIAETKLQLQKFDEAKKTFEEIINNTPNDETRNKARGFLAQIEANIKGSKANDNNDKQKDKSSGQVKNTTKNGYDLPSTEIVPVMPKEQKPEHKEIVQKPNKDNLVEEEPESPSKYFNLANDQLRSGKFEDAYKNLINALEICPKDDKGQIKMIKDLFDNNHEKKNSTHCNNFAGEFFKREEYKEAEKYFRLAVDLGKEDTKENQEIHRSNLEHAQTYLNKSGQLSKAKESLKTATLKKPEDKKLSNEEENPKINNNAEKDSLEWHSMGLECLKKQDFQTAESYFLNALKFSENQTIEDKCRFRYNLASAQFDGGKFAQAQENYEIILKTPNISKELREISARSFSSSVTKLTKKLMSEHKYGDALKTLEKIADDENSKQKYWKYSGYCYYELKEYTKAHEALGKSLKLKKDDKTLLYLIKTQKELKQFDSAIGNCEALLGKENADKETKKECGDLIKNLKEEYALFKYKKGLLLIKDIKKLSEENKEDNLEQIKLLSYEAEKFFKIAVLLKNDNKYLYILGQVQYKFLGKYEEAIKNLNHAKELCSEDKDEGLIGGIDNLLKELKESTAKLDRKKQPRTSISNANVSQTKNDKERKRA